MLVTFTDSSGLAFTVTVYVILIGTLLGTVITKVLLVYEVSQSVNCSVLFLNTLIEVVSSCRFSPNSSTNFNLSPSFVGSVWPSWFALISKSIFCPFPWTCFLSIFLFSSVNWTVSGLVAVSIFLPSFFSVTLFVNVCDLAPNSTLESVTLQTTCTSTELLSLSSFATKPPSCIMACLLFLLT